ncbi:DUF4097 family beta strand repeat-containing protein [Streptomyces sp. CB01881]|uniref:DUF4097 family beta strand repeat-containing protein n=1 Tax=Streptomyces sp. CB01881 TaxID=2078691 RepID=UPI000CDC81BE|nr:DUF4097 family beta strand repeat-containing protein [Streptomyces sp. CB01881]AUY53697.1 hypothetical protein C2142_38210 [Streptomyces sp. CB01881]TYC68863.1 hypothetical protein EH183_38210 [Streptomyces sp. CB01881]
MWKFATPAPIAVFLEIPAGCVQVIAGDRVDATVEVRPADPGRRRDVRAAERTVVSYADGILRIHAPQSDSQFAGPSGALDVTVQLPAGSSVAAKTAACEFNGVGRLGDVAFEGAYRRITLDEAAAVRLAAVDGDVEVGRLSGPAEISTTRGDIRIAEAVRGMVVLSTQSGDITVGAAAGASAALDAGTGHGRISNSLRSNGTAELEIRATTSYGDITVRSL